MDRRTFLVTTAGSALATAVPAFAQLTGEDARLRTILDQMFEARVDDSPRFATSLGLDKGPRAALKSRLDDPRILHDIRGMPLSPARFKRIQNDIHLPIKVER